jgi:elongation factor Ts
MVLTIEAIKQLREETSAGVMECRQALEQASGDIERALALLRERGLEKSALQIAAAAPHFVRDEDIPAEILEKEAQQAEEQARQAGKPEALLARIVEGQLKKFRDEDVLLRQVYIRDEKITVAQLLGQAVSRVGENIVIRRFVRWELEPGEPEV